MNRWIWAFIFLIGFSGVGLAQEVPILGENPTPSVPIPLLLNHQDLLKDSTHYSLPRPPRKYIDGTTLECINDTDNPPDGSAFLDLTQTQTLAQIPVVNKKDRKSQYYYWHPFMGWNYSHYRDGTRQWYGWHTGETFHWLLWHMGRFWWYDDYAGRWLYYYQGFWWWQGSQKPIQVQVFMSDGHFYACDKNGVVGDDLMRTGVVEDVTNESTTDDTLDSDKHSHHHGGGGQADDDSMDSAVGNDNPANDFDGH